MFSRFRLISFLVLLLTPAAAHAVDLERNGTQYRVPLKVPGLTFSEKGLDRVFRDGDVSGSLRLIQDEHSKCEPLLKARISAKAGEGFTSVVGTKKGVKDCFVSLHDPERNLYTESYYVYLSACSCFSALHLTFGSDGVSRGNEISEGLYTQLKSKGLKVSKVERGARGIESYSHVATTRMLPKECDSSETGRFEFSCKFIEVGQINGYIAEPSKKDPRWRKIEQYWQPSTDYLKFAGVACGRADNRDKARDIAKRRAYANVKSLIEGFENDYLTGKLSPLGYVKSDEGFDCKEIEARVAETQNDGGLCEIEGAVLAHCPTTEAERQEIVQMLREQAAEEAERQRQAEREQRERTTATFILHNADKYKLGVKFFSQTRNNVWPAANKQYILVRSDTYRLSCKPGEKICFGAWRDYQTIYWGVGRGKEGCANCCIICGGGMETTLQHGGPDRFPSQNGGGGVGVADILNAFGAGMAIGNALSGSGGGGGYGGGSAPVGRDQRKSGISE